MVQLCNLQSGLLGELYMNNLVFLNKKEQEHTGIVKYIKNSYINIGDKVAFTKNSEYEFNVGGEKLYRMKHKNICLLLDGQVAK